MTKSIARFVRLMVLFASVFALTACGSSSKDGPQGNPSSDVELLIETADGANELALDINDSIVLKDELTVIELTTTDGNTTQDDVTDKVTWSISETQSAATLANGVLTAHAERNMFTVTASYGGNEGHIRASIKPAGGVWTLSISPSSSSVAIGSELQFTAQKKQNNLTESVNGEAIWVVENENIAEDLGGGKVKGKAAGSTQVSATYFHDGQSKKAFATLTVTGDNPVSSLDVTPATLALNVGESANLKAEFVNNGARSTVTTTASYTPTNTAIATVSTAGVVKGNAAGNTTITVAYTSNGKVYTDTVAVSVSAVSGLSALTLSPASLALAPNASATLYVMGDYGTEDKVLFEGVTWISSNETAATVANGVVTAKAKGNTTITASVGSVKQMVEVMVGESSAWRVHAKKPSDWAAICTYAWYQEGTVVTELSGKWSGSPMTAEADGWYSFTINAQREVGVIFNDCAPAGKKTGDLTRGKEGWYDVSASAWSDATPNTLAIDVNPAGGNFAGDTLVLTPSLDGAGAQGYYSVDGANVVMDGSPLSDGQAINIPTKAMTAGQNLIVNLYAKSGSDFVAKRYTFTKQIDVRPTAKTLGAVYSAAETTFSLWSPDTANVAVVLDGKEYPMSKIPDFEGYSGVYAATVPGNHRLKKYQFKVNGKAARDPYGVMVEPGTDWNIVMDLSETEPTSGWAGAPAFNEREDAMVYEVHVRDFTIAANSGVSANKRGKFLGMVEAGTKHNGVTTGLDHLKELGITHVQILPFYDYGTCSAKDPSNGPGCYNWGYDPENFNVPEEGYAVDPVNYVERMRELKETINTLHKNGIRVVMDVVYNHTWMVGKNETMFTPITSKYFWGSDLSGTGNAVNPRVPMVSRYIRDSLEYWVREYKIDGFRFDLMGIFDYSVVGEWAGYLNEKYPDRKLLIYGEPWNGYATDGEEPKRVRLGTVGNIADKHVGVFNSKIREAMKGENDKPNGAYIFNELGDGNGHANGIVMGVRGGIRATQGTQAINTWDPMFANDPEQSINYVSAHDNWCLWDKINAWANAKPGDQPASYLSRIQKFAHGIVFTSQGIAFLHAGEEMLRTKQGDHNSYKSSDAVNQIDWSWKVTNKAVYDYHKALVQLRRNHPAFRMNTWQEVNDNVKSGLASGRPDVVITNINGAANGDSWKEIIVIYVSGNNYEHTLPSGTWKVAVEKENGDAGGRSVSGTFTAEGTAVSVLYR